MVCRLNLTEREPPKQLNPINMIPPPLLLHQIIKHIGAKVRPSYCQNKGRREAIYYKQLTPIIEELHLQGCPMWLR